MPGGLETDLPVIAIVRSINDWARALHRHVLENGGAVVRSRPLEERQVLEDEYDVFIIDDVSHLLSADLVAELHHRNRRVLGVYDTENAGSEVDHPTGKAYLLSLAVDGVIPARATPEEFLRMVSRMAPTKQARHHPIVSGEWTLSDFPSSPNRTNTPTKTGSKALEQHGPRRRGHITAVVGASGGIGATEIAIELARALGHRGERTVVVDGDELAPSLAQRLNLALHPNLRTAMDVVEHGTGRLSECLTSVGAGVETLVGIPHPKDWIELRTKRIRALLEELSRGRPQIAINTSTEFEDLTAYGGADRFALSRTSAAAADAIVVVCAPTPTGVARLVDAVTGLRSIANGKPIHIVINKTPKGNFRRKEIALEVERTIAPASISFLPEDAKVAKAAWEGTLTENGDFTKAVAVSLAEHIPHIAVRQPESRAQRETRRMKS